MPANNDPSHEMFLDSYDPNISDAELDSRTKQYIEDGQVAVAAAGVEYAAQNASSIEADRQAGIARAARANDSDPRVRMPQ